MKLMTIIIQDKDSDRVLEALVGMDFSVTRLASTGGFLRKGNVTLLLGLEAKQVDMVIDIIKNRCTAHEPNRHAATIFVLDMPEYMKV
ncbi:MAG: cyclic-di-AMP receptor [Anaerolineaceae bacterium]|nr:cyclic-di-AMP receptor [Anaerolineaceae bacterium]